MKYSGFCRIIMCTSLILWGLVVSGAAEISGDHDFNVRISSFGSGKKAGFSIPDTWAPALNVTYLNLMAISEEFALHINASMDGRFPDKGFDPSPFVNYPVNIIPQMGFEYNGVFTLITDFYAQFLPNSRKILFPAFLYFKDSTKALNKNVKAEIVERYKSGVDLYGKYWINDKWSTVVNCIYNNLTYDYFWGEGDNDIKPNLYDRDLWIAGSSEYTFGKEAFIPRVTLLTKSDLNTYSRYNWLFSTLGAETHFKLFKKRIIGLANLFVRYQNSGIMKDKGYAVDLGLASHIRFYYEMVQRFYLKGDAQFETAPLGKYTFRKQRYDGSLRYATVDGANVEFGSWVTMGGITPRNCFYGRCAILPNSKWEVVPEVRGYMLLQKRDTIGVNKINIITTGKTTMYEPKYYRTDIYLLVKYKILGKSTNYLFFNNLVLNTGFKYQNQAAEFPPGLNSYLELFTGFTNYL